MNRCNHDLRSAMGHLLAGIVFAEVCQYGGEMLHKGFERDAGFQETNLLTLGFPASARSGCRTSGHLGLCCRS